MAKTFELRVNSVCEDSTILAGIRGNTTAKTIKLSNCHAHRALPKGSLMMVDIEGFVEVGNYLVPTNFHIRDTHVSGKAVDMDALCAGTAGNRTEPNAHTPVEPVASSAAQETPSAPQDAPPFTPDTASNI
jgi:hypothetical protein